MLKHLSALEMVTVLANFQRNVTTHFPQYCHQSVPSCHCLLDIGAGQCFPHQQHSTVTPTPVSDPPPPLILSAARDLHWLSAVAECALASPCSVTRVRSPWQSRVSGAGSVRRMRPMQREGRDQNTALDALLPSHSPTVSAAALATSASTSSQSAEDPSSLLLRGFGSVDEVCSIWSMPFPLGQCRRWST
ncbi:hypothetical protein BC830DRAFT_30973 [Chytriomyces sp. MP71]|nr:hypothetical protein BC830DRAFT_30973 [Chytriomyces sp. MP71]